uniref:exodeoxyribonuclease III n=1 Tax=Latimeria chalumnae TaxID=7897 RepID=H3A3P3_LATCH
YMHRCMSNIFFSFFFNKARGVAILKLKIIRGGEGRLIMILIEIKSKKLLLVNIYAPVEGDPQFFYRLNTKLQQFGNVPIIIGGDFNEVLDLQLDRSMKTQIHPSRTNKAIHTLISEVRLVDIWRLANPTVRDYTFLSKRHKTYSRIDYFLISQSLVGDTLAAVIETQIISDHSPILFTHTGILGLEISRRWKLNVSLCKIWIYEKIDIKNSIREFLKFNSTEEIEQRLLWDSLKAVLKGRLISYAPKCKKVREKKMLTLEAEIKEKET